MRPSSCCSTILLVACTCIHASSVAHGQAVFAVVSEPVDHPVMAPVGERNPHRWRMTMGNWGESFVEESLRLRGYKEVHQIRSRQNRGIDWIAVKRGPASEIIDAKLVEAKTHRGGKPRMSLTKSGQQMSRKWLEAHFRAMRASGDGAVRGLASELSRFRKSHNLAPDQLGEIHELNTRTDTYVRRNPITREELSREPLERHLKSVQAKGTPIGRRWAVSQLGHYDQVHVTSMSDWLSGAGRRGTATALVKRTALRSAVLKTTSRRLTRLVRVAGPIGVAAAAAMDANEVYGQIRSYRAGQITRREMLHGLITSGGGIAGAAGGAAAGAWVGAFGGPFAWATIPIGAGVGGIAGYFAGSAVSGNMADAWFERIDEKVKWKIDYWLVSAPLEL